MTTIAWDGTTLAADSHAGTGGNNRVRKLRRAPDGRLLGATGRCSVCAAIVEWLATKQGERPTWPGQNDVSYSAIEVLLDGRVFRHDEFGSFELLNARVALGSGEDFALAAMMAGADACHAVEIACELDESSAGPVDTLTLEDAQNA